MPVIPEYDASEKLDTAKMPTVSFDTSAQQAAARQGAQIQNLGAQLSQEAERWQQIQDQKAAFTAKTNLSRWQESIDREDADALSKMPENGQGFAAGRLENFDKRSQEFIETVPPNLRQEFAQRTAVLREHYHTTYASREVDQLGKFSLSEVSKGFESAKLALVNDPAQLDVRKADLTESIRIAPGIPEAKKPDIIRGVSRDLELAAAGKLHEIDPEGMAKTLGLKYDGGISGATGLEARLITKESRGRPGIVNDFGFAGLYQFGAPRLQTLGVYKPGPSENLANWNDTSKTAPGKWTGTFDIPGHPEVKTLSDFLGSREAQRAVWGQHTQEIDRQISARGLDQFIGKTVGGVEITRDGIVAMAHLGGMDGAERALRGQGNAADANGSTVLSYARLGGGGGSGPAPTADPRFANLTTDDRINLVKGAEANFARRLQAEDAAAKNAATAAELQRKSYIDQLQFAASKGQVVQEDIDLAWSKGAFKSFEEYNSVKKQLGDADASAVAYSRGIDKLQQPSPIWDPTSKEDKDSLSAIDRQTGTIDGLQRGDANASHAVSTRFADTGMVSKEAKGIFEGILRGGSPQQLSYAMGTLDKMYRRNAHAFNEAFPADVVKAVTTWQSSVDRDPSVFRDKLKRPTDPLQAKTQKEIEKQGRELVEKMDDGSILKLFDETPFRPFDTPEKPMGTRDVPGMAVLREEYADLFAEGYATSDGNPAAAARFANDRIKMTWANSPSSGNKLMKFAPEILPESVFPTVAGTRKWMREQVDEAIQRLGKFSTTLNTLPGARSERELVRHALVATPDTRAEIDSLRRGEKLPDGRKSPAWTLLYEDPITGMIMSGGNFSFDVDAAWAARAKYLSENTAKATSLGMVVNSGLSTGTALSPLTNARNALISLDQQTRQKGAGGVASNAAP